MVEINENHSHRNINYTIDYKHSFSTNSPNPSYYVYGLNDYGQIVGTTIGRGLSSGFIISDDTQIHNLGSSANHHFSGFHGINNLGQVVGSAWSPNPPQALIMSEGSYETFAYPGSFETQALDINNFGQIVGEYVDENGTHGFVGTPGHLQSLDVPNASRTIPYTINDWGQIAGTYTDAAGAEHGFLKVRTHYITVDVPTSQSTSITGINDWGQLVGSFVDSANQQHGFILTGRHFHVLDLPDISLDINNLGQILGRSVTNAPPPYSVVTQIWVATPDFMHDREDSETIVPTAGADQMCFPESQDLSSLLRSVIEGGRDHARFGLLSCWADTTAREIAAFISNEHAGHTQMYTHSGWTTAPSVSEHLPPG